MYVFCLCKKHRVPISHILKQSKQKTALVHPQIPGILQTAKRNQTFFSAFKLEVPGTAKINVRVVALAFKLEVPGNSKINVTIALHITK